MERADGTTLQARERPEESFAGHKQETPWDDLRVAYFQGEALWTYLTTPFFIPTRVLSPRKLLPSRLMVKLGDA